MTEYTTVIEVWYNATDDDAAEERARNFKDLIDEEPGVKLVEVEDPEEY